MTDNSDSLMQELVKLAETDVSPEILSEKLLLLDIQQTEQDDPELGYVLRACAIPPKFDAEVIGVIRNELEDYETNESLLEDVVDYPFVISHKEGGFVYHDNTRELLLKDWKRSENLVEFDVIVGHLKEYYRLKYAAAQQHNDALEWLNHLLRISPSDYEALLARAGIYFRSGNLQSALADLSHVVKLFPSSHELYFIRGRIHFENRNYERALANYNLAIEISSSNPDYLKWRALLHWAMGNVEKALADLDLGIEYDGSKDAELFYLRSQLSYSKEDTSSALRDLHKAIELQPKNTNNFLFMRRIYRDTGDQLAALDANTKAIDLQPRNGELFFARGRIQLDLQDYKSAIEDFRQAAKLGYANETLFFQLGECFYALDEFEKAVSNFSEAIKSSPDNHIYHFWRGQAKFLVRDIEGAITDFSNAIQIDRSYSAYFVWRARGYTIVEDHESAKTDLEQALKIDPQNVEAIYYLADTLYRAGEYHSALSTINQALEIVPSRTDSLRLRRLIYRALSQNDMALQDAIKVIELDPSDAHMHFACGRIYYDMSDYQAAVKYFQKAENLGLTDDFLSFRSGQSLFHLGEIDKSMPYLIRATELNPKRGDYYFWLFLANQSLGKVEESLQFLQEALKHPFMDEYDFNRAKLRFFLMLNDQEEALKACKRCIEIDPSVDNYLWLRRIYRNLKDNEAAIRATTSAIEIDPNNSELYYMRGRIYYGIGDFASTLYDWDKAVEFGYENRELYLDRARLFDDLGLYQKALRDINKVIEINPASGSVYRLKGQYQFKIMDYLSALESFTTAISMGDGDASDLSYYYRGQTYYLIDRNSEAIEDLCKAVEIHDDKHNRHWLSRAYAMRGDFASAKENAEKALSFSPDDVQLLFWLAMVAIGSDETQSALSTLDSVVELKEDFTTAVFWRELVIRKSTPNHDNSSVFASMRNSLENMPDSFSKYCELARLSLVSQDPEMSRQFYSTAFEYFNFDNAQQERFFLKLLEKFLGTEDVLTMQPWFDDKYQHELKIRLEQ